MDIMIRVASDEERVGLIRMAAFPATPRVDRDDVRRCAEASAVGYWK
jgi:hypothetical protein